MSTYEVTFRGVDEASAVANAVAGSTDKAMGQVTQANQQVEAANKKVDASTRDVALAFTGAATSAFALYNAVDRVMDMQVSVDRANLAVKTSLNAVEDAQNRYNAAVEKYGAESPQAVSASKDLALAQERHTVAMERAEMIQGNLNEAMVSSAISVIPSLMTMVTSISTLHQSWGAITRILTAAQHDLNAAMAANPIGIVIVAIVALVAILIAAYQTCEPFRNAVNAIGAAIMTFVKPAIDAIVGTLKWLWDVLTNNPLAAFFRQLLGIKDGADTAASGVKGIGDTATDAAQTVTSATNSMITAIGNVASEAQSKIRAVTDEEMRFAEQIEKTGGGEKNAVQEIRGHVAALQEVSAASTAAASTQTALKDAVDVEAEAEKRAQTALEARKAAYQAANMEDLAARASQATALTDYNRLLQAKAQMEAESASILARQATEEAANPVAAQMYHAEQLRAQQAGEEARFNWAEALKMQPQAVGMQHGGEGIVSRPTLFLAGEAGPEPYAFGSAVRGGGSTIFAPQITIQGSVDEHTIQQLMDRLRIMFRGITVEASSSFAPTTSKRLRMEGARTIGTGVGQ